MLNQAKTHNLGGFMNLKKMMIISSAFIAATAVAATLTLEQVNTKLVELVAPFNNQNTQTTLVFTDLLANDERALKFGVNFNYAKQGSKNKVVIAIDEIRYDYGNGVNPLAQGSVSIQTDLIKAFGLEAVNGIGEALDEIATEFAKDIGKEYGDALIVEAKTSNLVKDQAGNIVSISIELSASMDFSKLPQTKPLSEVEFRNLKIVANLNKHGVAAKAAVLLNPAYKGFNRDQAGMKEYIQLLVSQDQKTYEQLRMFVQIADMFVTKIVEKEAQ